MQEIERLLRDFGPWVYGAMFAYAFLKTGPLPIFGGYASTLGWLDAGPLLAAVWSGAVLGDLARFELGRQRRGTRATACRLTPRIHPS